MGEIVVRAMLPEDHERIAEIFHQRQVTANTLQIPFTTAAERLARWVMDDNHRQVVALVDGLIVGHGGLTINNRRRAHVGGVGMAVDEAFQGLGVGTALLSALID
ncbi:MAG: GNAT family N-acetyltransferase, partial [Vicinamibacterales bacterium]